MIAVLLPTEGLALAFGVATLTALGSHVVYRLGCDWITRRPDLVPGA